MYIGNDGICFGFGMMYCFDCGGFVGVYGGGV